MFTSYNFDCHIDYSSNNKNAQNTFLSVRKKMDSFKKLSSAYLHISRSNI